MSYHSTKNTAKTLHSSVCNTHSYAYLSSRYENVVLQFLFLWQKIIQRPGFIYIFDTYIYEDKLGKRLGYYFSMFDSSLKQNILTVF